MYSDGVLSQRRAYRGPRTLSFRRRGGAPIEEAWTASDKAMILWGTLHDFEIVRNFSHFFAPLSTASIIHEKRGKKRKGIF
jgi:hypothetical protein